jgi:DNA-directed RNA polymerase beta subunit
LRYGNKSVISKICEDDEMPFTEDGRRVDLMLNLLAIINRKRCAVVKPL